MIKFYVFLGLLFMSPILIPVIIFESSIAIPIMIYTMIRMKIKAYQRANLRKTQPSH